MQAASLRVSLLTPALVTLSGLRGNRLVTLVEFGLSEHDAPAFAVIRAALQASAPPPVVRMKPWSTVLLASLLVFNLVVAIDATSVVLVVPVRWSPMWDRFVDAKPMHGRSWSPE